MPGHATLTGLIDDTAAKHPDRLAIEVPGRGEVRYGALAALADRVRDRLLHEGVRPGDRVGIHMSKSIDAVAAILGIHKAGAAYVPVDPNAPIKRCAFILADCEVCVVLCERRFAEPLAERFRELGRTPPTRFTLDEPTDGSALDRAVSEREVDEQETVRTDPDDLAYILYTSGSTGKPKGVMLTHRAACSFIDWCAREFEPGPDDVFSSHAPLHFDLSIHDVFVSLAHGARLVLIDDALGKDPMRLAAVIARSGITVWYSTPSILNLVAHYGKLDRHDFGALRLVLFAGEVFPIPQLRRLEALWPEPRYYNLYGPTETNVCTFFPVPDRIPADRIEPFPIGRMCPPLRGKVVDSDGAAVPRGDEGELVVAGPGVMSGYWKLPAQNERAFLVDDEGERWYRTGDVVVEQESGDYRFVGRVDRMVKRRGYRIELGEVEAGLAGHPDAREVAVVALPDSRSGVRIKAYMSLRGEGDASVIELKRFSAERLPRYMIPDTFEFVPALPRTSTDKIDYRVLEAAD